MRLTFHSSLRVLESVVAAWLLGAMAGPSFANVPVVPDDLLADARAAADRIAVMTVTVNGEPIGGTSFVIQARPRLLLDRDTVARAQLARSGLPETRIDGTAFIDITSWPGLRWSVAEAEQRLDIVVDAALLPKSQLRFGSTPPQLPQTPPWGGFLNYSVFGYTGADSTFLQSDSTYVTGAFETVVFGPYGTGAATFVANPRSGYPGASSGALLLEANWRWDDPEKLTTVVAGDAITAPGWWGRAVRFGGVQVSSNFALQPGFVTYPLLSVSGVSSVPTAAEIFSNNVRLGEQNVPAGPFSITNLPALNGAGELQVVVRNALGQETVISQPFYVTSQLLKPGLSEFSYSLGSLRYNYGIENVDYRGYIGSAFYRYGVNDALTVQGRAEASDTVRGIGVGADYVVGLFGVLSAGVAASNASGDGVGTPDGASGSGARVYAGFSRQTLGVSFGVQSSWATPDYREVGDTPLLEARVSRAALNFALPGRAGSLAFAWSGTRYVDNGPPDPTGYDRSGVLNTYSASYSLSLGHLGFVAVSASRTTGLASSTQVMALYTLPFGTSTGPADTSFTLGVQRARSGNDESTFGTLDIQRPLPVGKGYGYYAHLQTNDVYNAGVSYYGNYARYALEASAVPGANAVRASVAGGAGIVGGHPFVAPPIEQSFAVVEVGELRGVRVLQENQDAGTTGADGSLVLPRLPSYTPVNVAIDPLTVPIDVTLGTTQQRVVTLGRTGILVRFDARRERNALVRLVQADGTPVPAGAVARIPGRTDSFPVAMGGEVYLSNLDERQEIVVMYRGRSCRVPIEIEAGAGAVADLGPFVCALAEGARGSP